MVEILEPKGYEPKDHSCPACRFAAQEKYRGDNDKNITIVFIYKCDMMYLSRKYTWRV